MKKRVTGIGGIFFKSNDPKKLNEWYGRHLGFDVTEWGTIFQWKDLNDLNAKEPASTVWCPFKSDSKKFQPSEKPFMFNYRVENLKELLEVLKAEGVQMVGEMEEDPYGKFAWILDPEGNKIELWEPKDE